MTVPRLYNPFSEAVVSDAGATSVEINTPSPLLDTELLFGFAAWRTGDGVTALPTFTEHIDANQLNGPSLAVYSKTASAEPATHTFTYSGTAGRVLAFMTKLVATTGIEAIAVNNGAGVADTNHVAPSVTSLGRERLLVCIFSSTHTDTYTPPASMTFFDTNNSGGSLAGIVRYLCYTEIVGEGATGTRTATIAVARNYQAVSLLLAPSKLGDVDLNYYMSSSLKLLGHTGPSLNDQLYSYWNGKSTLGTEASILDHKQNFLSSFPGESVQEQEINWMKTKAGFPGGQIQSYQDVSYWFWSTGGMA